MHPTPYTSWLAWSLYVEVSLLTILPGYRQSEMSTVEDVSREV